MKKFLVALLTGALALTSVFALTGCGETEEATYVAKAVYGIEVEEYGFAVGNNATKKAEIVAAMNEVIADVAIDEVVAYYTAISNDEEPSNTLEFADLSDNTAGTLNVYTCSGFEPYEFVDANNKIIGVDVYLMELVCEKLNMKINVVDMDFSGICGKVAQEDNAVGAAGITITEERKLEVTFSNPYYNSVQYIISPEAQAHKSLVCLAGKKIGVQKGTTGAMLVDEAITEGERKDTGATMVEYDTGAVAYTALKAGKIDFIVIDELPAKKLVGAN
jgi:polar amino acid transport system substrate-binding protein